MREMYKWELPWWLRAIGAWRINRDSIDFSWGYFSPTFGLELLLHRGFYFDSQYRLSFCFLWGKFHIKLPFKTKLPQHCDWPSYGLQVFHNSLWIRTGDCEQNQRTRRMISWDFPFVSLIFDRHEVKNEKGEWVPYIPEYQNPSVPDGRYIEIHPYRYVLRNGDAQERPAPIYMERRIYHRKWLPFWTKVFPCIDIKFSDEVGERTGSWKGGAIGCGYKINEGESILACLRRMEADRKFN